MPEKDSFHILPRGLLRFRQHSSGKNRSHRYHRTLPIWPETKYWLRGNWTQVLGRKNCWQEEPPRKNLPIWHRYKPWKHGHQKSATTGKNVSKLLCYSLHQPLTQVPPFSGTQLSHQWNERPELDQLITFLSYSRPPLISWRNLWTLLPEKIHIHKFLWFQGVHRPRFRIKWDSLWRQKHSAGRGGKKGEMSDTFVNHPLSSARHQIMTSRSMCVAFIN